MLQRVTAAWKGSVSTIWPGSYIMPLHGSHYPLPFQMHLREGAEGMDQSTRRLDNLGEDGNLNQCPKCAGVRVWAGAHSTGAYGGQIELARIIGTGYFGIKRAGYSPIAALVCTECG